MKYHDLSKPKVKPMTRRRFLQAAAGGAMAAAGLTGCGSGGGGGNGSGNGGGNGGGEMSYDGRTALFDSVKDFIRTLPGSDVDQRRQAILGFLKTRPELAAADETEDGTLWARFTDGRFYLILPSDDDGVRSPMIDLPRTIRRSPPAEIPNATSAYVFLGVPQNASEQERNDEIRALLAGGGYNVTQKLATPDDLKTVANAGAFYILAHGGVGYDVDGQPLFGMTTSVPRTTFDDQRFFQELKDRRLGYATVTTSAYLLLSVKEEYYVFSDKFVREYMSFGPNSVVFAGACMSASPNSPQLAGAFHAKGAAVYAGWTRWTQRRDNINAALFTFDRLLGANQESPDEDPDQRAFDYVQVKNDLRRKGLDRSGGAELVFLPGTNGESGLLAPTIRYMDVVEHEDKLILTGKFGSVQGRVEVDRSNRPILSWSKEKIEVKIPRTGQGSAGDVAVFVGDRESNHRLLSDWRITFDVSQRGDDPFIWQGPLHVHIRADVGSHRDGAGDAPVYRAKVPFRAAADTTGNWVASGRINKPGPPPGWTEWRGSSNLVNGEFTQNALNAILCYGEFDPGNSRLRMVLVGFAAQGMSVVGSDGGSGPLTGSTGLLDGPYSSGVPLPSLDLVLDNQFGIPGSTRIESRSGYELKMTWQQCTPSYPPDDVFTRKG